MLKELTDVYRANITPNSQLLDKSSNLYKGLKDMEVIINKYTTEFSKVAKHIDFLTKMADEADNQGNHNLAQALDDITGTLVKVGTGNISNENNIVSSIIKFADELDNKGFEKFADLLNDTNKFAYNLAYIADELDKKGNLLLANVADKILKDYIVYKEAEDAGVVKTPKKVLSSRYCPDHRGAQMARISETEYKCALDGKVYNYETGFTNYEGENIAGGSIQGQTLNDMYYIPMTRYDTRNTIYYK